MKTNRLILWSVLALALISMGTIGLLVSCSGAGLPGGTTGGAIKIVGAFQGQRSILPPVSMEPAEWRVQGTGAGTFDVVVPLAGGTIESLTPGAWHLVVTAQNAAHDAIGEGTADCVVIFGQTVSVNVSVIEYSSPDGAVSGQIQWEPNIVDDPNFNVTLTDTAGAVVKQMPFDLDLALCTGSGNVADVHPGWWTAIGILKDGARDSTGFAAAVRVAAGRTTAMNVALHALQTSGNTGLTFTWSGINELMITGSPAPGDLQLYTGQTIPMAITSPETGITVAWYVNGLSIGTGTSIILDAANFNQNDYYRLDAVAISADQQRASSLTWNVIKGDSAPNQVRISGSGNCDGFNTSWQTIFTLRHAETPGVVYASVIVGVSGPTYAFNGLPAGNYVLQQSIVGNASYWRWWTADGGSQAGPDVITIPTVPNARFDFLRDHGW